MWHSYHALVDRSCLRDLIGEIERESFALRGGCNSIGLLEEVTVGNGREIRFVRRPGSYGIYESAWSCLHKFASQNHLTHRDVVELVAIRTSAGRAVTWGKLQRDLNTSYGFDLERLAGVLELDQGNVSSMFTEHWTIPKDTAGFIYLRFCPKCIENGFHTALFQYELFQRCPWHNVPLKDGCPACGHFVYYTFDKESASNPYGCRCGEQLWKGVLTLEWPQNTPKLAEDSLNEYLAWKQIIDSSISEWNKALGVKVRSIIRGPRTDPSTKSLEYLAHQHMPMSQRLRNSISKVPNIRTVLYTCGIKPQKLKNLSSTRDTDSEVLKRVAERHIADDCTAIIKSINRRIKKSLLSRHRQCLVGSYEQMIEGPTRSASLSRHIFVCPWHEAYLCWHAHWFNEPGSSNANEFSTLSKRLDTQIQRWTHMVKSISELPKVRWVIRHVIAEQALSVFRESLLQARDTYSENHAILRTRLTIDTQTSPHFYLREEDNEAVTLFLAYPGVIELLQEAKSFPKNHGKEALRGRASVIQSTALRRPGTYVEGSNWRL